MVERIVENLLANAERHTTPDTPVWVRLTRPDQGVLITVEDAGAGVPPALRAALFEPFRQGPQVPAHAPGVGIGLTLVARFAELHGGSAWVEERPGGGASFRVLLCDPPTPPAAAAPPARQDGRGHAEPRREHLEVQEPPSGAGSA
jgi:signal transduction histidine kinase